MSDVTRQPGGTPAERDPQFPGAHGEAAPGTDRADRGAGPAGGIDPAPGARADQAAGPRTGHDGGIGAGHDAGLGTSGPAGGAYADQGAGTRTGHDAGLGAGHDAGLGATGPAGGATGPASGTHAGHDAGLGARVRDGVTPGSGTHGTGNGAGTRAEGAVDGHGLLPHEECDRLGQRLHHAVTEFVDAPRASVEEADRVLEELAARFTDAVTHRRRALRTSWHDAGEETRATSTDTEQLRLALRDYRELADRLMHV
ncbi:hypothetical protein ACWDTR_13705 [Streptomyces sp. NPDC003470]|uniref:hypothetical protein n=1 Tax=unclassified Streptomyces TaxID=2593676 RepID=UPI003661BB28